MKSNYIIPFLAIALGASVTIGVLAWVDNYRLRMVAYQHQAYQEAPYTYPQELPPTQVPPVPEQIPLIPPAPQADSRSIDAAITKGTVLTVKNDYKIEANSPCTWALFNNNTIAVGFYVKEDAQARILPTGTKLTVELCTRERLILPGNVMSVRNQNGVIQAKTPSGIEVFVVIVQGDELKLVGAGGRTQYQGLGRVPTVDELRSVFDVEIAGPGVITRKS